MAYRVTMGHRAAIRSLTSSLQQFTPKATEALVRLLSPFAPEGVPLPDLALVLQILLNMLLNAGERLTDVSWQRRDEGAADKETRGQRDSTVKTLRPKVQHVSDCLLNALGPEAPARFGIDTVETIPMALYDQVVHLDKHLRSSGVLEKKTLVGITIDPVALADSLEPEKSLLGESLDTLTAEERATEAALLAKDRIVEEIRTLYVAAAKVIEGFYRLAGLDKEAERLRLTVRRRNNSELPGEGPDDEVAEEPVEELADEEAAEQATQD